MSRLFTSESVTEGHPDKVADSVSDAVLDALLAQDVNSRVAVETLVTTGTVVVAGEVSTEAYADISGIARERIISIGYDHAGASFDGKSCGVLVSLGNQSPDIAQGVDLAEEVRESGTGDALDRQGAGDQGLMFGYACTDTPTLMPLPIDIAHRLSERLAQVRRTGELDWVLPDGKTQVTVEYDGDRPVRVDTVVVSTQHTEAAWNDGVIRDAIVGLVIDPVLARYDINSAGRTTFVNPTGKFVIGGPMGDAGVTGRKIIVDTYG
ncbi:MAG TPA: methionine adenosyltransferase, partial [Propioniciclava sp.]